MESQAVEKVLFLILLFFFLICKASLASLLGDSCPKNWFGTPNSENTQLQDEWQGASIDIKAAHE